MIKVDKVPVRKSNESYETFYKKMIDLKNRIKAELGIKYDTYSDDVRLIRVSRAINNIPINTQHQLLNKYNNKK